MLPDLPVVGDVVVERIEADRATRVVGMSAAIGYDRRLAAKSFEPVPHSGRDLHQAVVVRPRNISMSSPLVGDPSLSSNRTSLIRPWMQA